MYKYIKKLQSKKEEEKKQVLVFSLVISMAIVGAIWIYSLNDRFNDNNKVADASDTNTTTSPFSLFTDSVVSTYHDIAASVGNISFSKKVNQNEDKQIDLIVVDHVNVK